MKDGTLIRFSDIFQMFNTFDMRYNIHFFKWYRQFFVTDSDRTFYSKQFSYEKLFSNYEIAMLNIAMKFNLYD